MNIKQLLMVSALVVTMAVPAMAQSDGSTSSVPVVTGTTAVQHPRINEIKAREENQTDRIQQGVASGEISPQQAAKDQAALQKFNSNLKSEVKANGGHLTKQEYRRANSSLNGRGGTIHRQKR
jgi:hypothetical protein